MKIPWQLLFLLFQTTRLFSQESNNDINEYFNNFNNFLSSKKSIEIIYSWTSKPILSKKEYKSSVQLFVDRTSYNDNSISNFLIILSGKVYQLFYDNQLFLTDTQSKIIKCYGKDTLNYPTVEELVKKKCLRLYLPFVKNDKNPLKIPSHLNVMNFDSSIFETTHNVVSFLDTSEIFSSDSSYFYFNKNNNQISRYLRKSFDKEALDYQIFLYDSIKYYDNNRINIKNFLDSLVSHGYRVEYPNPYITNRDITNDTLTINFANNFLVKDINNNIYELNQSKSRLAVIDFSYMSCYFCVKSIPFMDSLYVRYSNKNIDVFWIDPFDYKNKEASHDFFKRKNILYPVYYDELGKVSKTYNVQVFPTIFIVELPSKKIIKKYIGYSLNQELEIEKILSNYIK